MESLSLESLKKVTKVSIEEFVNIKRLDVRCNCVNDSLQFVGEQLINLQELKLNDSTINSLRDIGTTFRNLKVLWISRCNLTEL